MIFIFSNNINVFRITFFFWEKRNPIIMRRREGKQQRGRKRTIFYNTRQRGRKRTIFIIQETQQRTIQQMHAIIMNIRK